MQKLDNITEWITLHYNSNLNHILNIQLHYNLQFILPTIMSGRVQIHSLNSKQLTPSNGTKFS